MRRQLIGLATVLVAVVLPAPAQNEQDIDLIEANGLWSVEYPSDTARTYFLVYSTDMHEWHYLPYVEVGTGNPAPAVGLTPAPGAPRYFAKLRWSEKPPTPTAKLAHFDGDDQPRVAQAVAFEFGPLLQIGIGFDPVVEGLALAVEPELVAVEHLPGAVDVAAAEPWDDRGVEREAIVVDPGDLGAADPRQVVVVGSGVGVR